MRKIMGTVIAIVIVFAITQGIAAARSQTV